MSQLIDHVIDSNPNIRDLLTQMDQIYNESATERKKLADKIDASIAEMEIDTNGSSKLLEAQVTLLAQRDRLIAGREKAMLSRIQLRMKHQESETQNKALGAITAKILQDLNVGSVAPFVPTKDQKLDTASISRINDQLNQLEDVGFDLGEIRTDAGDIT